MLVKADTFRILFQLKSQFGEINVETNITICVSHSGYISFPTFSFKRNLYIWLLIGKSVHYSRILWNVHKYIQYAILQGIWDLRKKGKINGFTVIQNNEYNSLLIIQICKWILILFFLFKNLKGVFLYSVFQCIRWGIPITRVIFSWIGKNRCH